MTSLQTDPSITIDLGAIQDIDYVAVYVVSQTGRARLGHHTVSYLEDHTQWHLAPSGSSYCDYGDNALVSDFLATEFDVCLRSPSFSVSPESLNMLEASLSLIQLATSP